MYDAIIVGARCAGAPTAMLLARRGFKVLLVDKATFPSDTISTHILWPHGAEILGRWGLLQRLAGTGATTDLSMDDLRCRSVRAARHDPRRERRHGRVLSPAHGARRPSGPCRGRSRRRGPGGLRRRRRADHGRYRRRYSRPCEGWAADRGAGPHSDRRRWRELLRGSSRAGAGVRPSAGCCLWLLLVLQWSPARRHRAVCEGTLRVWWSADQRRPSSRDGELAD